MDEIKVFVSSSSRLINERQVIKRAIKQIPKFKPIMFEDFGARTESPRTAYLEEVRESDVYLGVLDKEFSEPTAEEYYEADDSDKDILIYVSKVRREEREERLATFIEELDEHTWCPFENVVDLEEKVKEDLLGLVTRNYLKSRSQKMGKNDIGIGVEKAELALNFLFSIKLVKYFITEKGMLFLPSEECRRIFATKLVEEMQDEVKKKGKKLEEFAPKEVEAPFVSAIILTILENTQIPIEEDALVTYMSVLSTIMMGKTDKEEFYSNLIALLAKR